MTSGSKHSRPGPYPAKAATFLPSANYELALITCLERDISGRLAVLVRHLPARPFSSHLARRPTSPVNARSAHRCLDTYRLPEPQRSDSGASPERRSGPSAIPTCLPGHFGRPDPSRRRRPPYCRFLSLQDLRVRRGLLGPRSWPSSGRVLESWSVSPALRAFPRPVEALLPSSWSFGSCRPSAWFIGLPGPVGRRPRAIAVSALVFGPGDWRA